MRKNIKKQIKAKTPKKELKSPVVKNKREELQDNGPVQAKIRAMTKAMFGE